MPDPDEKLSSPTLDACERNVTCTGANISKAEKSKEDEIVPIKECMNPCAIKETKQEQETASAKAKSTEKTKDTAVKVTKDDSAGKEQITLKEKQAVLNKEPCPPSPTCQLARPEPSNAKARVDKAKAGCVDFETCEDDEEEEDEAKGGKLVSGCMNYEDCRDLAKEEKRKLEERKQNEKQKKKDKPQNNKELLPCPKK